MAKHAALTTLLDPSIRFRPPLTHTIHRRPALVDLSRFRVSPILTHSIFRRFSTCISAVSVVSLVGVSLMSADVAVAVVRPEVISQRFLIPRGHGARVVPNMRRGAKTTNDQEVGKITFRGPMIVRRHILNGWHAVENAMRPRESALRETLTFSYQIRYFWSVI
jgi:hypothetical protein